MDQIARPQSCLVGGLVAIFYFPINIGLLIIPIDQPVVKSVPMMAVPIFGPLNHGGWGFSAMT